MPASRALTLGILLFVSLGCGVLGDLTGPAGLPEGVTDQIKSGELPAAHDALVKANQEDPANVEVAINLAYTQMLAGDYKGADKTLANVEATAPPDQLPGIKLRRATIGLRAGNIDSVRVHAKASGLPEGKLLAAEVHIADLQADMARPLLTEIQNEPGPVGQSAKAYLAMLDGGSQLEAVAEITALWALGDRKTACEHAAEVILEMDDDPRKVELQLLWASRAVTSGQVGVASALISDVTEIPSPDLAWRVEATKAIIAVAEGRYEEGVKSFDKLAAAGAPADGLADARATAAALAQDPVIAKQLIGDLESAAAARGLMQAGAAGDAPTAAPDGSVMKKFLEKR